MVTVFHANCLKSYSRCTNDIQKWIIPFNFHAFLNNYMGKKLNYNIIIDMQLIIIITNGHSAQTYNICYTLGLCYINISYIINIIAILSSATYMEQ